MEFIFLLHSQLIEENLEKIVSLKSKYWDYSIEEHKKWISNNIKDDDIHVLMLENEILVGYLNFIKIEVIINGNTEPFLGIGNVCSAEKGKGYGKELLNEVNRFLIFTNQNGILFCKDELMPFYEKSKWTLIDKRFTSQLFSLNINVMLFNFDLQIISFKYEGRNF